MGADPDCHALHGHQPWIAIWFAPVVSRLGKGGDGGAEWEWIWWYGHEWTLKCTVSILLCRVFEIGHDEMTMFYHVVSLFSLIRWIKNTHRMDDLEVYQVGAGIIFGKLEKLRAPFENGPRDNPRDASRFGPVGTLLTGTLSLVAVIIVVSFEAGCKLFRLPYLGRVQDWKIGLPVLGSRVLGVDTSQKDFWVMPWSSLPSPHRPMEDWILATCLNRFLCAPILWPNTSQFHMQFSGIIQGWDQPKWWFPEIGVPPNHPF